MRGCVAGFRFYYFLKIATNAWVMNLVFFQKIKVVLPVCLLIFSCSPPERPAVAFYYWKTALKISDFELEKLDSLAVKKLYVRFFDVDWDALSETVVPVAPVEIDTTHLSKFEIIPVIFITNRTFLNAPAGEIAEMAEKVFLKIEKLKDGFQNGNFTEIQFDCDWTERTAQAYFSFLKQIKKRLKEETELSATIRLHQVKFFEKTGVPPVDRGLLMFYNMGDLDDPATENSILDLETATAYLQRFDEYPLDLDVALPVFSWAAVFRDGELIHLIHGVWRENFKKSVYFKTVGEKRFLVNQNTYLEGYYLYAGDEIRVEEISPDLLAGAARMLQKVLPPTSRTVSFYHLDSALLRRIYTADFEKVLDRF